MENKEFIFWNVDTQVDFVEPEGKLYVSGAEKIKPIWQQLTDLAKEKDICVVNTADFHYTESAELSDDPDFVNTFPQHCMANTRGAEYITETQPEEPVIFDWDNDYDTFETVRSARNIIIRKDAFDVFAGNPFTDEILQILLPKTVVVYGVTTNVCVNDAVVGLSKRVEQVIVIEDAIKELPNIPLPFDEWEKLGIEMMSFGDLKSLI